MTTTKELNFLDSQLWQTASKQCGGMRDTRMTENDCLEQWLTGEKNDKMGHPQTRDTKSHKPCVRWWHPEARAPLLKSMTGLYCIDQMSQCSCHGEQDRKSGRCLLPPSQASVLEKNLAWAAKCTLLLSACCYTREARNPPGPLTGDMRRAVVALVYMVPKQEDGQKGTAARGTSKGCVFM